MRALLRYLLQPLVHGSRQDSDRRSFLKTPAALPLAGLPAPQRTPEPATYHLGRFYVAGFQYHEGPALVHRLRAGQTLDLVPEPENPHDPRAVRIAWDGAHLGYVPRRLNRHLHALLQQGAPLRCTVASVQTDEPSWRMLGRGGAAALLSAQAFRAGASLACVTVRQHLLWCCRTVTYRRSGRVVS